MPVDERHIPKGKKQTDKAKQALSHANAHPRTHTQKHAHTNTSEEQKKERKETTQQTFKFCGFLFFFFFLLSCLPQSLLVHIVFCMAKEITRLSGCDRLQGFQNQLFGMPNSPRFMPFEVSFHLCECVLDWNEVGRIRRSSKDGHVQFHKHIIQNKGK